MRGLGRPQHLGVLKDRRHLEAVLAFESSVNNARESQPAPRTAAALQHLGRVVSEAEAETEEVRLRPANRYSVCEI